MALVAYKKTGLTGGTADDLDSVDGDDLSGGEVGFVFYSDDVYFYELDESSGAAEDSPLIIAPDANPGNKRWILHGIILGGETDFQGNYALQLQNIPDLASKGAGYYWFDGVDDYIEIADDHNIDFGIGDFSVVFLVNSDSASRVNQKMLDKRNGWSVGTFDIGFLFQFTQNKLNFELPDGAARNTSITPVGSIPNNYTWYHIAGVRTGAAGGSVNVYIDGKDQVLTQSNGTNFDVNVDNAIALRIGYDGGVARNLYGSIPYVKLFNLALTAAEIKALSSGAPVPYKYIGASQTEFFTTANDRTFAAGATNWENVDIGTTWDETTDLSIVASATGQYGKITFTNIGTNLEQGKRYRLTYDYAETTAGFEFKLGGATGQTLGDAVAGTGQTIEFTAIEPYATTDFLGIYAKTAAAAAGNFDNFSLKQIGCVLQLEQDGIGHGQWIDKSGNELHGTVSGALPTNLAPNHQEKYIDLTVTGNTSFTLPMGYQIKSIIVKNTTANALTGGLDIGFAVDGTDVVAGMAIGANATVPCTLVAAGTIGGTHTTADDTIYLSDGDDDTNWNGAELEVRVQMQRLTVN